MGVFEERMGAATVSVVSPDGRIRAVLRSEDQLTVTFRPGSYGKYREIQLALQLAALASAAVTGWQRARALALEAATGRVSEPVRDWRLSESERDYRALLRKLQPVGRSPGRCVNLTHTGGEDWRALIKPGTLGRLSEEEFAGEFAGTFSALRHDESIRAALARHKVYSGTHPRHREHSGPSQHPTPRKRALRDG